MLSHVVIAARTSSVCRAQHLLRRAYPNDGIVEPVSPARGAGGQFARKQMLSRAVREGQGRWVNMGCAPYPFLYSVSGIAEIVIAAREAENHTRMIRR